jgi:hypothetical protein
VEASGNPLVEPPIAPPPAAFLGFVVAALVHVPAVWAGASAAGASVFTALVIDAAHFVCAGLIAAAGVGAWTRWSRRRLAVAAAALMTLAIAVGWPVLESDFHNFCIRQSDKIPPLLNRFLLTSSTSMAIPAALLVGRALARFRWGRWVGLAVAVGMFAANERLLPRDYVGIHLYLAWIAAILAGATLAGATVSVPFALPKLSAAAAVGIPLAAGILGVATLGAVRPSARVLSALAGLDGSVLVPFTGRLHAHLRRRSPKLDVHDPWLERRNDVATTQVFPPGFPSKGIVILLTIDALRADLVDSKKYDDHFPNLANLRKRSLVFAQARAPGTATRPSLACTYMGTYTFQQYWIERRGTFAAMPTHDDSVRFPELLIEQRVWTANLTSMRSISNRGGVVRGFKVDKFAGKPGKSGYAPASAVVSEILSFLDKAKPPAFLFSHFGDPHEPYDLAGVEGSAFERYLGEVALVDRALGPLFERLNDDEFRERTVLIVSADHGESFGEHGSASHGTTLYDEALRVPLLVHAPGVESRTIDDLVSLIDLGPTILDLFGVNTPGHFMGQSLKPFLFGETPILTRPIIAEARSLLAYVDPTRLKVILDTDTARTELYDLRKDPLELDNIADDASRLERPLGYLEHFYETHRTRREGYEPPPIR